MRLSEETLKSLHALIEKDPALLAQLQLVNTATQAACLLAQAAQEAQLPVDEAAIRTHFENSSLATTGTVLSDAQLEVVAGGASDRMQFVLQSIFSMGIACLAISRSVYDSGKPMKNKLDIGTVDYCIG